MPKIVRTPLTATAIKRLKQKGKYYDGGYLYLHIRESGSKQWFARVPAGGRRRDVALGGYPVLSLAEARDKAIELRRAIRKGETLPERTGRPVTFKEAFEAYWEVKRSQLGNGQHIWHWQDTIRRFACPSLANKPIAEITAEDILTVVKPIWHEKPETATRLLQRLESIFKNATTARNTRRTVDLLRSRTRLISSRLPLKSA